MAIGAESNRTNGLLGLGHGFLGGGDGGLDCLGVGVGSLFRHVGDLLDDVCLGLGFGGEVELIDGSLAWILKFLVFGLGGGGLLDASVEYLFGIGLIGVELVTLGLGVVGHLTLVGCNLLCGGLCGLSLVCDRLRVHGDLGGINTSFLGSSVSLLRISDVSFGGGQHSLGGLLRGL